MLADEDEWLPDDERCAPGLDVLIMCVVAIVDKASGRRGTVREAEWVVGSGFYGWNAKDAPTSQPGDEEMSRKVRRRGAGADVGERPTERDGDVPSKVKSVDNSSEQCKQG